MITISNMTPGPLTLNISTFVGLNIAGVAGAIVATIAAGLFCVVLTSTIYDSYKRAKSKDYWDEFLKSLRISSTALITLAAVTIFELLLVPEGVLYLFILVPFGLILAVAWIRKWDTMMTLLVSSVVGFI